MIWRLRSRSRTICVSLAFVSASLYLLLLLASHSIYLRPCDTLRPPKTHTLRDLAYRNVSSVGVKGPDGAPHRDSSSGKLKGHAEARSDGKAASTKAPGGAGGYGAEPPGRTPVESGLSKLEALFDHPLYNLPQPPIPEEDKLLKVRAKAKASERSSQMWSVLKAEEGECWKKFPFLTTAQLSLSKAPPCLSRVSDSPEEEGIPWSSSSGSHPPWLRFHLAISRWQLYPHRDPNMGLLIQQLATHRIVSAGVRSDLYCLLFLPFP